MIKVRPHSLNVSVPEMETLFYRQAMRELLFLDENIVDSYVDSCPEVVEILGRMREGESNIVEVDEQYHYEHDQKIIDKKSFLYNRGRNSYSASVHGIKTLKIVISINDDDLFSIRYDFYRPKETEPFYFMLFDCQEFGEIGAVIS